MGLTHTLGSLAIAPGYIRSPPSEAHMRNWIGFTTWVRSARPGPNSNARFAGSHVEGDRFHNVGSLRSLRAAFGRPRGRAHGIGL